MAEAPGDKDKMLAGHRNFLRQAIYSLYVYNRTADAMKWFKYLGDKFPDKPVVENDPNSLPKNLTLDETATILHAIESSKRHATRTLRHPTP